MPVRHLVPRLIARPDRQGCGSPSRVGGTRRSPPSIDRPVPYSPCPPPDRGGDRPNAAVPSGGGAFAIPVRRNKAYTQGSDNADSVSFQQFGPLFRLSAPSEQGLHPRVR